MLAKRSSGGRAGPRAHRLRESLRESSRRMPPPPGASSPSPPADTFDPRRLPIAPGAAAAAGLASPKASLPLL